MGSEATPKLRLLSIPAITPKVEEELSGTVTPPFNASAAVPFLWEEAPGKPRPCNAVRSSPSPSLEPPPRMFPKAEASPTTVLEGPYVKKRPKASSFRMTAKEWSNVMSPAAEGVVLVSKRWLSRDKVCFLSSKRRKLGKIIHVSPFDSLYSDSDYDEPEELNQWSTTKNITKTAKSHFWATIYGGLKQVIPWKAKKTKEHDVLN